MKPIYKKIIISLAAILTSLAVITFVVDVIIMPWYVDKPEVVVPDVVGLQKDEALKILEEANLNVVVENPKFNDKIKKDHIVYQKPDANSIVKDNRRVYIAFSSGNHLAKMPDLMSKTLRNVEVTLKRLGLVLDQVSEVKSEQKANTIVHQFPKEGTNIPKGTKVSVKISIGPNIGMVRVPDLLGQSLKEAEQSLSQNSLKVGKVNYQISPNLLPNTVIEQYPSKNKLLNVGSAVDIFVTKAE
ncbi:MAG: PASTA domain-containing protein [Ignavibacteriae bacterium]|nr:PASTA domain-containing protein [Ignavibacteriota bacterium]